MSQCVGSGYCCRTAPCGYSLRAMEQEGKTWDQKVGCRYLVRQGIQYRCGLYLGATPAEKAEMESVRGIGVGAGCSSPLFNTERERILRTLRSSSLASRDISSGTR